MWSCIGSQFLVVIAILLPFLGVGVNVFPDSEIVGLIADDVVVIPTLPNGLADAKIAVNLLAGGGFQVSNHFGHGRAFSA
jgi:hypothetical protein